MLRFSLTLLIVILLLAPYTVLGASQPTVALPGLLLTLGEAPAGSVSDNAVANAESTARVRAYRSLVMASAFAGYRTPHGGLIHSVLRLQSRAAARYVLRQEGAVIDTTRDAAHLTLSARYGDGDVISYQQHGPHDQLWVFVLFTDGPYLTVIGAYDHTGEQQAINQIQRAALIVDKRLRQAARFTPDQLQSPTFQSLTLTTMAEHGGREDTFSIHSTVFWHAVWRLGTLPAGARETVIERVSKDKRVIYTNTLTDTPFIGDNIIDNHMTLQKRQPGVYAINIEISIGQITRRASHIFRVIALPSKARH